MDWKDPQELLAHARAHKEGQDAHGQFVAVVQQWTTYFGQMTPTVPQMSEAQLNELACKYQEASTSLMRFQVAAERHAARGFGRDFLQQVDAQVQDMNAAAVSCAQMLANRRKTTADIGAVLREAQDHCLESQMRANRHQSQVYDEANRRFLEAQRHQYPVYCGHCRSLLDPITRWENCPHCGLGI